MKTLYIVSAKVIQYHRQGVEAESAEEAVAMLRDWKHWGRDTYIETDAVEVDPDPDERDTYGETDDDEFDPDPDEIDPD